MALNRHFGSHFSGFTWKLMPRANRTTCAGLIWHITHRCHQRSFLLKFKQDRRRWRHWLYEATQRYGLTVLNYIATSNHVHLLVADQGKNEIATSMQLVAGRTAQEYNKRKNRNGAFWEDRYHATAVQSDDHLIRCLIYIDLNMVRAGVAKHPRDWEVSGYHEIQQPRDRKGIIDHKSLHGLIGISKSDELQCNHAEWIKDQLSDSRHDPTWTTSVGVGDADFLSNLKIQLGAAGHHRKISSSNDTLYLREQKKYYTWRF
jgi:putative transposase